MQDSATNSIAQSIYNFQAALEQDGENLAGFLNQNYAQKWCSDNLHHAMAIRTTFVNSMHNFLTESGLLNMERVSMSPVTDPLAHDIEHSPSIDYKGHRYMTTHSMIYSKFLACMNPRTKGVFVDSPNIRLELESPTGQQRGKYLVDFSQMDIEVRRNRGVGLDSYYDDPDGVREILAEDFEKALAFFEKLIIAAMTAIAQNNEEDLKALGVALEVPEAPFPRFRKDQAVDEYGQHDFESHVAKQADSQFFCVTGLMRENYDLIYPYLKRDGSRPSLSDFTSDMVYNYDICLQSIQRDTGEYGRVLEIMSGAIREWLYEPIVARLIDNRVIQVPPRIVGGNIENMDELGGYGPFLLAAAQRDSSGKRLFPATFGGGVGIERALFALLGGSRITKIDDVTLFGKNPDTHPLYLF